MAAPDLGEQGKFFRAVFGSEAGYAFISTLDRATKVWTDRAFVYPLNLADMLVYANASDASGLDVYAAMQLYKTPNYRRKELVKVCPSAWADLDAAQPHVVDPPPSVLVESSPGRWQGMWRTTRPMAPHAAEALSKRIAYAHAREGADLGGWDLTQVLRIPGTHNHKYPDAPLVRLARCEATPIEPAAFERLPMVRERVSVNGTAADHEDDPPVPLSGHDLERWQATEADDRSAWAMAMVAALKENGLSDALVEVSLANHPIYLAKAREKWGSKQSLVNDDIRRCIQRWREKPPDPVLVFPTKEAAEATEAAPPRLTFLTAEDVILGEAPDVPWLISAPPDEHGLVQGGLLAALETAIVGAESGAGKTWLLHELVIAAVTGTPLFGHFPIVRPLRILLVDEESSLWLLRQRFAALLKGRGLDPARFAAECWDRVGICLDQGFSFDNERSLEALHEAAARHRPDYSIYDTLTRVHRQPENDNSAMAGLFEEKIKPYKRAVSCGLIFAHHLRKSSKDTPNDPGSMLRGASDLKGQLDEFWFLRGKSGNPRAVFEHDKCRSRPELPSFTLVRERDPDGGVRLTVAAGAATTVAEQHAEVLLRFLVDNGRQSRAEIAAFAKTRAMSFATVRRTLDELLDGGQIDRAQVGREAFFWPVELDL